MRMSLAVRSSWARRRREIPTEVGDFLILLSLDLAWINFCVHVFLSLTRFIFSSIYILILLKYHVVLLASDRFVLIRYSQITIDHWYLVKVVVYNICWLQNQIYPWWFGSFRAANYPWYMRCYLFEKEIIVSSGMHGDWVCDIYDFCAVLGNSICSADFWWKLLMFVGRQFSAAIMDH
jgi:hypothetical protein